jgi:methylmalonyl-CoA/ethylmalonyl-CoA epimerase
MTAALFTEIDHVAIAVNDLEAAIAYYRDVYGAVVDHREIVESDGVEEALLKVADSYIQLLTPTRADSPVAKYLEKKGEGLHHIGYRVADCGVALEAVKAAGGKVALRLPLFTLRRRLAPWSNWYKTTGPQLTSACAPSLCAEFGVKLPLKCWRLSSNTT